MKKPIYIFSSGELKRKDNTLFFESDEEKKYIPVERTSEIYLFGEVDINKRFLEFATQSGIPLHFFNRYEYYTGSYYPREQLNSGHLLLKQAECYLDLEKRMELAKTFVTGAFKNMEIMVSYYLRRGKEVSETLEAIKKLSEDLPGCEDIENLMALEGNARIKYYRVFDTILEDPDFYFVKRSKRPPENYLNTLISFGNTLLYTNILSEIYRTHLDPRIGFLHATNFRRFSLNLDVAEVFKPIIVDRIILTVVGRKIISKKDFEEDAKGLLLKEASSKKFIAEFENKLQSTLYHKKLKRNVSYRRLLRLELYKLEKHLLGDQTYNPYHAKW